ncbi:MAG: glutathione S-transferase family protein [Steroidobacteraceae bacterium]
MAIDFYWGSGSPPCWRVALALECKGLEYRSHLLHFDRQEHKSPQMLAMNFRGRLPVLRDDDYVVFESLAILYYLDQKYPRPPIFGRDAHEAGVIMRVICEYQSYAEPPLKQIIAALLADAERRAGDDLTEAMHRVAGEARTIEQRLAHSDWVVGESISAADMMIYPDIRLLLRALQRPQAHELAARFLPMEINYPAIGRWLERVAALPGHDRTWPPHWRP